MGGIKMKSSIKKHFDHPLLPVGELSLLTGRQV